jgi:hypothetical protein
VIVNDRQTHTHVIICIFGEHDVELFQELDHLVGSIAQLVKVAIRIDVAEASSHRLVNKEQVRKLGPGTIVVCQIAIFQDSVGANLHQGTVHRTTSGASVEP